METIKKIANVVTSDSLFVSEIISEANFPETNIYWVSEDGCNVEFVRTWWNVEKIFADDNKEKVVRYTVLCSKNIRSFRYVDYDKGTKILNIEREIYDY